jgi:TatD DNase family protein
VSTALHWVDTHTHLEYDYPFSLDEYIRIANESEVKTFISIGTTLSSFNEIQKISEQHDSVFYTVGIHPHESKDFTTEVETEMKKHLLNRKCLAVGEIGLDYYYNHSDHNVQKQVFEQQLQIAIDSKKPVSIHTRDAEQDTVEFLKKYSAKTTLTDRPGVLHCFSGSRWLAEQCLNLGFYLSFSGILTFKTAQDLRETASWAPLDRILLETDSPYLAPVPFRGKPNHSAYLVETARVLASLRQLTIEELAPICFKNSNLLFKFQ